jgi:cytochrome c-type biogenesis protein
MVELYSPGCPSCASMKPIVDDLKARCTGRAVRIVTLDVSQEENGRIAERYGVSAVPTFLFLDGSGGEVGRLVGAQTATDLLLRLRALGGPACAEAGGESGPPHPEEG